MKINYLLKYMLIVALVIGGFYADFETKRWAEANLKGKQGVTVISGFLDLGFAENRGMVFGLFNGSFSALASNIMAGLRIFILIGITIYMWMNRKRSLGFLSPFILFWAGASGNLIDHFLYGYVVDFIHIRIGHYINWPFFFNLADVYVTAGIPAFLIATRSWATRPHS